MCESTHNSSRTRHMDTRARYVQQLCENELITVEFVKSELNKTDGNTKNLQHDLFDTHNDGIILWIRLV